MRRSVAIIVLALLFVAGPALLVQASEEIQKVSDYVKIWHDETGMPHVVASSTYGVYFGYGYCLGRDRMFQLELLKRSTEGTLAEVFGEEYLDADLMARRDAVPFAELKEGLQNTGSRFKRALAGFTGGINRSINDARRQKFLMDPAFARAGIQPLPFTPIQVLNIFAGTMAARYNDFSQEIDNQHLLAHLVRKFGARVASNIFEDVVFYQDKKVYTTLGKMPYFKPGFRFSTEFDVPLRSSEPMHSPTLRNRKRNEALKKLGIADKSGSYGAVLSNLYRGKKEAWILGGPQMGYFTPSALYAIGLHTPEYDIVGTTPVGYLAIIFAANRHIGFTATAGVGNVVDILALKQHPQIEDMLVGGEFSCQKQTRLEQIMIKGKKKSALREIAETPVGPVIARDGDTYYVKNRAWRGHVVSSYEGWFASAFAKNLDEWLAASDRNALSINWLGADKEGNVAFVHCGLGKTRRSFGDDRLPVSTPSVFPSPDQRLAAMNPATGFYVNWNCPPVDGYRSGDLQSGWAADQRSKYIADHLAINHGNWSLDYLEQLDKDIAFTDQRAYFFKDLLLQLIETSFFGPVEQKAFMAMQNWNNLRTDNNGDGFYDDPGAGVFEAYFNNLYNALFAEYLGDFAWMTASDATWTQSALVARALLGQSHHDYLGGKTARQLATEVFVDTVKQVTVDGYHLPKFPAAQMQFAGVNHAGAPTMKADVCLTPFMNRGSDVQLMKLTPDGIKVFGCLPPGNAAFGENAKNQIADFKNFVFKPRALTMKEVRQLRGRFMVVKP